MSIECVDEKRKLVSELRDLDKNKAAEKTAADGTVKIEIRRLDRLETTERLSNSSGN
ncbi:hypothetical protein IMZ11_00650 [Microtetraspora sp. AC03309]|uniref:hypothetical protein n=1 Tax=Microtetraspora sp. AC03309 TaxID=2779376 RepID=UPI001E29B5FF|nr:hypothetical protein [Microtetraspora sp. AC03309]MCC5574148.1 hypothetical protein [Microtetraspora sp. AC03309]